MVFLGEARKGLWENEGSYRIEKVVLAMTSVWSSLGEAPSRGLPCLKVLWQKGDRSFLDRGLDDRWPRLQSRSFRPGTIWLWLCLYQLPRQHNLWGVVLVLPYIQNRQNFAPDTEASSSPIRLIVLLPKSRQICVVVSSWTYRTFPHYPIVSGSQPIKVLFYFILKNLVLWTRSEIDGSALEFCV